jgi:hypothetical protein
MTSYVNEILPSQAATKFNKNGRINKHLKDVLLIFQSKPIAGQVNLILCSLRKRVFAAICLAS